MPSPEKIRATSFNDPRARKHDRGFTLVEVITLIGIVALMALWMIPTAAHVRPGSQRAQCVNNFRQMANAFKLYANDNDSRIVSAYPVYGGFTGTWCAGNAQSGGAAGSYVYGGADPAGIQTGLLWPYTQALALYRCPTDRRLATDSTVPAQFKGMPILRSIAMNSFMAGTGLGTSGTWSPLNNNGSRDPNRPIYVKESEMKMPAKTFIFVDEESRSINDGMFMMDLGGSLRFIDMPTGAHRFGYGICYMDGSAEINQFQDDESKNGILSGGGLRDWMTLTNVTTHPL